MSELVRFAVEGGVARVTLDRPPLNVLSTPMMRELARAVQLAGSAPEARILRLDAAGKVFCAGVDVADHEGDALRPMMDALDALFEVFDRVAIPTVAVVRGAALGGGCELVLATDLCLASERASFGQPEVRLGVFAPPASVLLPRLVGERRALGFLLTGSTVPAAEALSLGLVNRVYPDASFAQDVDAFFAGMSELSGSALRMAKRAVTATRDLSAREAHRRAGEIYMEELMPTEDASEGLRAFLEKRPPVWKHR